MGQTVKLRRSAVSGRVPINSQLQLGELSVNTADGKLFFAKSGSLGPSIEEIITTNTQNTGSIDLVGALTASVVSSSFIGDGSELYNIPASGVVGLSLDQISSDGAVAAITAEQLDINVNTVIDGSLTATEITGSGLGLTNVPVNISGSSHTSTNYNGLFTKIHFDESTGIKVEGDTSTGIAKIYLDGVASESGGGDGSTKFIEVTTPSSTWTFNHGLGEKYPSIMVFDSNNNVIIPQNIEAVSTTQLVVSFASPQIGYVTATVGGGLPTTTASDNKTLVTLSGVPTWKEGILSGSVSFNSFSSSIDTIIGSLETESGSVRTTLNTYTSSNNIRVDSIESKTGSFLVDSDLSTLEGQVGSLETTSGSHDGRLDSIESKTGSFLVDSDLSTLEGQVGSLETESGSVRSTLNTYTSSNDGRVGSLETTSGSHDGRLDLLEIESGSVRTTLNAYTSSNDSRVDSIESQTGSYLIDSDLSTLEGQVGSLETESGSVRSALNTYTASNDSRVEDLVDFKDDTETAIELTGSNVTIKGNLLVKGTETRVNSTTVEVSDNVISLNGSGAANGGIEVRDVTSPGILSGSLIWDGTDNKWKAGVKGSEDGIVLVGDLNSFTSSNDDRLDRIELSTSSLNSFTSSINTTIKTKLDTEGVISGSIQIDHDSTTNFVANEHIDHSSITIGSGKGLSGGGSIDTSRSLTLDTGSAHFLGGVKSKLNTETVVSGSVQIDITGTTNYNLVDGRLDSLESNSGSYLTEYNDEYTTGATFNSTNGVITYTRNDGDTFTVDIDGRYLTSFTETDPIFTASPSAGITETNITNWDSAYTYSTVGHLPLSGGTITGDVRFLDSDQLRLGTGNDLRLWHNGTNSYVFNYGGSMFIGTRTNDTTFLGHDGNNGDTTYFKIDGTNQGLYYYKSQFFADGVKSHYGASNDLEIYHDGSNSYITEKGTGNLNIKGGQGLALLSSSDEFYFYGDTNGQVNLYHNGLKKFETTSGGIEVSGTIVATGYNDGNWNTAYGWGDHSTVGYITGYSEVDTLDSVTNRGAITTNDVTTGKHVISKQTNTTGTSGTTFLEIYNNVGGDISQQQSFIDFKFTDTNANFTPQVRIGAQVGRDDDASAISKEGAGAFVVYTGDGTDELGGGTLTESFRVSYNGNATAQGIITATGGTSTNWNTAYGWGDHSTEGYLTEFTETDPVFTASPSAGITETNISNWDSAYGWGDHSTEGYLTSYNNEYTTGVTWTAATATLTFTRNDGDTYNVQMLETLTDVTVTGGTYASGTQILTLTKSDGSTVDVSGFAIDTDVNWYTTGATFNTGNGIITGTLNSGSTWTVDIDNRYLQLGGGTLTGNLTLNSTNPEILFNGTSDVGVDMAIKATPEGLDFYEPEDSNKIHFQILDDTGVNAAFGLQIGGTQVLSSGRVLSNVTGNISMFTNDSNYLTSFTETDPIFTASPSAGITDTNISNWNTAYGWGDHSTEGYIKSFTNTNEFVTGATFNSGNGVITFTRNNGGDTFTVDLDGRYLTSVTNISGYSGTLLAQDNRTISPSELSANLMKFGFTSWDNNNSGPYADFLHLRSYADTSGGADNLVMFKKSGIGMRIWQQTYGSATAYSSYEDVWTTGDFTSTNVSNWNTSYGWGDHASVGYITGYSEVDTLATVTSRGSSTTTSVRFSNDLNYFGKSTGNNEGEIVINTGVNGSPQIGFTEHGDASWALGIDDQDNSFKVHGTANSTIPTIDNLGTPLFEITTTAGVAYLNDNRIHHAGDFTTTDVANGVTAYGWGDHSLAGYTGDQDLSGYLLNTTDTFAGNLTIIGGNNNSKESFLNVKRGSGAGLWLKFQTDSTSANNVSQFVIRRSTDNVDILSINDGGNLSVPGTLSASGYNDSNWNTAYGWGDHSTEGYVTGNYLPIAGGTLTGDLIVGSITKTSNSVVKVLADQGYKAGFEAYGNGQGTGYIYVGQSTTHGGGMSYNGDSNPALVSGETDDRITFYRRTNSVDSEVFSYNHNSDSVYFNGEILPSTINTGQGSTEVHLMNQNIRTTDSPTFASINTGQGATEVHLMNQNIRTTDDVQFGKGKFSEQVSVNNRTAISVAHWARSSNTTGAIKIKVPGTHTGNWSMFVLRITTYEYNSNAHAIYYVSGHDWTSGWYQNGVTVQGTGKTLSLGFSTGANEDYIILGDVGSTWQYGHVTVDVVVHPEFYSSSMDITEGWSITQETALDGITINSVTNKQLLDTSNYGTKISNWDTAFGWGDHSTEGYATETYVGDQIDLLVDTAPGTLDTLNELAAALGDDPNFATTITTSIGNKLPLSGGTLTGDLIIQHTDGAPGELLHLRNDSNGNGATIKFSDQATTAAQHGLLSYYHADGASYGSGNTFVLDSTEANMSFVVKGKVMYSEGIYTTPATGTGAGTRKDSNWDSAYTWGNHADGGYLTSYSETDPTYTSERDSLRLNKMVQSTLLFSLLEDYNKPSGYSTMIQPTSYQNPLTNSHGYYHILGRRDGAGGYGALLQSYNGNELFHGNTTQNTNNISWYKIWTDSNFTQTEINNWGTAYGWGDHASAGYIVQGSTIVHGASWSTATKFKSGGDISQAAGNHSLQVYSDTSNDAFMAFHISGDYAVHFGLDDTSNRLYTGGWSDGTGTKYQIWDGRDFTSTNISNWDTAYGWGDHDGVYLPIGGKAADSDKLDGIDSTSFLRSDVADEATQLTVNTLIIGSSAKIQFQNNDFIRYDDANGVGRFHFDSDGGTNNASVQAATFVGDLSGNATTATTASNSNLLDNLDSTQFIRSDAADTFTGTITMGTQKALVANNYGRGVYGLYSATRYQHVWSMGTAYNLSDDGTSNGNLYGLAFTHTNIGGQSKSGLSHQMLLMENGITTTAIGRGIWTDGLITTTSHGTSERWNEGYTYSQVGHLTSSSTLNASNMTTGTLPDVFSPSTRYNIGLIDGYSSQTRDKLRVWDSGTYSIGMKDGYSYGHLGGGSTDYAMSFQMSNNNTRGFWWGDSTHTDAQGSMSLTTDGNLVVATSISIGQGETITAPSTTPLYVEGSTAGETVFEVQGTSGQLFSITDSLIGDIFEVSDISGVPIFTVNSSGVVTVDDTLHVTGDVIAYYASDRRLKDNIKPIENSIDKIKMIGGYEFDWNSKSKNNHGHDVGVIAQEIEEVLPELVGTRSDGFKGVKYEKLTALLIQANKELIERVEELESKLKK